jgi:hypothetical protein
LQTLYNYALAVAAKRRNEFDRIRYCGGVSDAEKLRANAAHLLAFAVNARQNGLIAVADYFTAKAAEYLEKAEVIETAGSWSASNAG